MVRILVSGVVCAGLASCRGPERKSSRWTVMGTYAGAEVYATTEEGARTALEEIRRAFDSVDASMSNWREDSELARLNLQARSGAYRIEDPELYRCLKTGLELARLTEGTFDPTVGPLVQAYGIRTEAPGEPTAESIDRARRHVGWRKVELIPAARAVRFLDPEVELDLGGIAKGYAIDVAIRTFARPGSQAGLVDLGRNLFAWQRPPDAPGWTIGIQDPTDDRRIMAKIDLVNRAISTSGNYENAGHILDPRTGRPADSDVVSATAIADSAAHADAMSTALFVSGSQRGSTILDKFLRFEAVLLVRRGERMELLASASLKGRLELDPAFAPEVGGRVRFLLPPLELKKGRLPWSP